MKATIQDVLDNAPLGPSQIRVVALVTLALILEGFDIQLAAFAAPAIREEWSLAATAMGPMLAAVMVGMAIGGAVGGSLGDRIGRRPTLILAVVIFGFTTCLASLASNLWQLTALRFIAGIGFGAAYPNAAVLVGEWAPLRVRAKAIALLTLGLPIGGLIGSAISAILIPALGWRMTFLAAGILPLVIAALMYFSLPESLAFMARDDRRHTMVRQILARLSKGNVAEADIVMRDEESTQTTDAGERDSILSARNRRVTAGFWLAFFCNFTVAYLVMNWLPMLLTMLGTEQAEAIRGSFYMNLAGIVGLVLAALIYPRLGSRKTLGFMLLGPSAAVLIAGLSTLGEGAAGPIPAPLMVLAGACLAYWGVSGATASLWSLSVHAYSVRARATGLGWANSVGRLGGLASTLIGGWLILLEPSPFLFLAFVAAVLLVEMIGTLIIDRHAPPIVGHGNRMPKTSAVGD